MKSIKKMFCMLITFSILVSILSTLSVVSAMEIDPPKDLPTYSPNPTYSLKPTYSPIPTVWPTKPPDFVYLQEYQTNKLQIGAVGAVKLEENITTGLKWFYEIGDTNIINIIYDSDYIPDFNSNASPGSGGTHIWKFKALKEGETKLIFTLEPSFETNSDYERVNKELIYSIAVSSSGEVTIRPTVKPTNPPMPPTPTPQDYIGLDPAITNVLNVGTIGIAKLDTNPIIVWSYEIGDRSIIDNLQIIPMSDNQVDLLIYPYPGPWLFTALKEGETAITFKGTTLNGEKILIEDVVFKIKVNSTKVTTKPTDGPIITKEPWITPRPEPTAYDKIITVPDEFEWAQEAITNLARAGIIKGYGDGTYRLENNVTRAEFATMLVLTFDIYNEDAISAFTDVSSEQWYHSYIASAEIAELAKGVGDGRFSPEATITREEMFVFCARAIDKYKGYETLDIASPEIASQVDAFVDGESVNDWAVEYVATVTKYGLVTGSPTEGGNAINPQAPITRAEVAVVLNRTMLLE